MRRLVAAGRGAARAALGLFIVVQLAFLLFSNVDGVVPVLAEAWARNPRLAHLAEVGREQAPAAVVPLRRAATWWEEATGQDQRWQLFAPELTDLVPFPAVELRWDGLPAEHGPPPPPVVLRSANEPADPARFLRVGHFRLRRFEGLVSIAPPSADATGEAWRGAVYHGVRRESAAVRVYLAWRLAQYRREHPDLPLPTQAILHVRLWRVPPPPGPEPWAWTDLGARPVACWHPPADGRAAGGLLEWYDPAVGRFEPLEGR